MSGRERPFEEFASIQDRANDALYDGGGITTAFELIRNLARACRQLETLMPQRPPFCDEEHEKALNKMYLTSRADAFFAAADMLSEALDRGASMHTLRKLVEEHRNLVKSLQEKLAEEG